MKVLDFKYMCFLTVNPKDVNVHLCQKFHTRSKYLRAKVVIISQYRGSVHGAGGLFNINCK